MAAWIRYQAATQVGDRAVSLIWVWLGAWAAVHIEEQMEAQVGVWAMEQGSLK